MIKSTPSKGLCHKRDLVFYINGRTEDTFKFVEAIPDCYAYAIKSAFMTQPITNSLFYRIHHSLGNISNNDCYQGQMTKPFIVLPNDNSALLIYNRFTEDDKNWVPIQEINTLDVAVKDFNGNNITVNNNFKCTLIITIWNK